MATLLWLLLMTLIAAANLYLGYALATYLNEAKGNLSPAGFLLYIASGRALFGGTPRGR